MQAKCEHSTLYILKVTAKVTVFSQTDTDKQKNLADLRQYALTIPRH